MTDSKSEIERLTAARDRLRQEVLDWMNAEGAQGRFRFNYQAPKWAAYSAAEDALAATPNG